MFQAPSITDCGPKVIMALRMVALRWRRCCDNQQRSAMFSSSNREFAWLFFRWRYDFSRSVAEPCFGCVLGGGTHSILICARPAMCKNPNDDANLAGRM